MGFSFFENKLPERLMPKFCTKSFHTIEVFRHTQTHITYYMFPLNSSSSSEMCVLLVSLNHHSDKSISVLYSCFGYYRCKCFHATEQTTTEKRGRKKTPTNTCTHHQLEWNEWEYVILLLHGANAKSICYTISSIQFQWKRGQKMFTSIECELIYIYEASMCSMWILRFDVCIL